MKKRIVSFALMFALLVSALGGMFTVSAAVPEEDTVQPMYNYISSTGIGLSISGTTATCSSSISCYSGTTKIRTTMTLQKKGFLTWSDVETWKQTVITTYSMFENKRTGLSSGSYRLKITFEVYQGTNTETITQYSPTRTCS